MSSQFLGAATDDNFEGEVLKSDKPVLIDFWAPWCGPCKAIGPIVEEIAAEYQDKIKVMKLNVDDAQKSAVTYGVRSIPTLMIFKAGKVSDTLIGLVPKEKLEEFIKKSL
ncbi:MAG: thioredoxin [Deltaproteobacteria bacterium HGW-Deltaproteobacteria-6]|jgi:thioredoxin 1|nr:MAG: thioredoxin [Deltaproteobacteria bacterium HGW-Deltaproteobacteria-6]